MSLGLSGMTVIVTFILAGTKRSNDLLHCKEFSPGKTMIDLVPGRRFAFWQSIHSIFETMGLVIGGILGSGLNVTDGWRL